MTDSQITQTQLIETAQNKLRAQLGAVIKELAWYRRYPTIYGSVIRDLTDQRKSIEDQIERFSRELAEIWTQ